MPEQVEPSIKMQLHRKIRELREYTTMANSAINPQEVTAKVTASLQPNKTREEVRSASLLSASIKPYKVSIKDQNAFNLWNHCMDESTRCTSTRSKLIHEAAITSAKDLLLDKVFKLPPSESLISSTKAARSGLCVIEILGSRSEATTPSKVARVRVFFDSKQTFEWLRGGVVKRLRLCVSSVSNEGVADKTVERFRDSQLSQPAIDWETQLGVALTAANQSLFAFLSNEATQVEGKNSGAKNPSKQGVSLAVEGDKEPTITCSVCNTRIALDDVEARSEACC